MFGYVTPVKEELRQQDFLLYRAFYCGICVETGKKFGSLPRFFTGYDATFLAVLVHDYTTQSVEFTTGVCVGNPFKKKAYVCENPLLTRVAAANVVLGFYKLCDDVTDGGGIKKRFARSVFKKAFNKARGIVPEVERIVREKYAALRELEIKNETSIDRASDCFASMLRGVCEDIAGKTDENFAALTYNIGKFVYLADALDDTGDDKKSGNYNPFLAGGREYEGRRKFFDKYSDEIGFALNSTVNRAIESFNRMSFTQSYSLLSNIVHVGLRAKIKELLNSNEKLPRPKI